MPSKSTAAGMNERLMTITLGFMLGSACTLATCWILEASFHYFCDGDNTNSDDGETYRQTTTDKERGTEQSEKKLKQQEQLLPAELRQEQLSRHILYFGQKGIERLKDANVCVVGLGGVGSHAAVSLGRAGVGRLRLIDFDQVTLSSLNRHAVAVLADVGTSKVGCVKKYLEKICPDPSHLNVEAVAEMYTLESGPELLELREEEERDSNSSEEPKNWNVILDCIDDVPTKAALLAYCLEHKIRVLSCMASGGKADPTRIHISDLRSAAKDPLASKLRQTLKKAMAKNTDNRDKDESYLDDMDRLAVIYSSEKPVRKLADFTPEQKETGVHHYGAVDGMRIRIQPVLGTMPAIMGQGLAALALTELATIDDMNSVDDIGNDKSAGNRSTSMQPVTTERVGLNVRNRILQNLKNREARNTKQLLDKIENPQERAIAAAQAKEMDGCIINNGQTWIGPVQVTLDDVEYLLEIWRNRCAVTGIRLGTVLALVRWDEKRPGTCDNLVLMSTAKAVKAFDELGGKNKIPKSIRERIEQRLASCRNDR